MRLLVEFVRVGRNHYVAPLSCQFDRTDEESFNHLVDAIYKHADRHLISRAYHVDVLLDPATGIGEVLIDGGRFGRGTISPQPEGEPDAPERE
jgi:hypothetical protein